MSDPFLVLEYLGFVLAQLPWIPLFRFRRRLATWGSAGVVLASLGVLRARYGLSDALAIWGLQALIGVVLQVHLRSADRRPSAPSSDLDVSEALARARELKSERLDAQDGQVSVAPPRADDGRVSVAPDPVDGAASPTKNR